MPTKPRSIPLNQPLPDAVLRRLIGYHDWAIERLSRGVRLASTDEIGAGVLAGTNPGQTVRKDIQTLARSLGYSSAIPDVAIRGIGTDLRVLAEAIERALPIGERVPTVILGAGKVGTAFASYKGFSAKGNEIVGIFDIDPSKVGQKVGDLVVRHDDELKIFCAQNQVAAGIVAVADPSRDPFDPRPTRHAVQLLIAAGVKSILQMSAGVVQVPANVHVRRVDVAGMASELIFSRHRAATNLSR